MTVDVLSRRALSRSTLERQLLLRRSSMPPLEAVAHLVGMQAQIPLNPYLGLWSRLERFRPAALARLLEERAMVRIVAMRGTIHLLTADDALVLPGLAQPVLVQELARHPQFGPALRGVDLAPVLAFGRKRLEEAPRTPSELRAEMDRRFPDLDPAALAYACRNHLALVQVLPRGVWGRSGAVRTTTVESWLGRRLASRPSIDDVVMRYLAAFGPASSADVSAWSRLTGMAEVLERLRPRLRRFKDETGRDLFDLPDAPRLGPDAPAPPRFLPEYDNVLLSHADRSRFVAEEHRATLYAGERSVQGTVLQDGLVRATWRIRRDRGTGSVTLFVDHAGRLTKRAGSAIVSEGRRMMRLQAADASAVEVRFVPLAT
jgi:DNA glycosylase AlkZ-like